MVNQPDVLVNSGESVESFKRKHIRQNKDIIKANTFQSLRIQNLEKEIRRLSMENMELRAANIHLQARFDKGSTVAYVRRELERKLQECGDILSLLNQSNPKSDAHDIPVGESFRIPPTIDEPFVDFGSKLITELRRLDLPSISESSSKQTSIHSEKENPQVEGKVPQVEPEGGLSFNTKEESKETLANSVVCQTPHQDSPRPKSAQSQPPLKVNSGSMRSENHILEKENAVPTIIKIEKESPRKRILAPNQSLNTQPDSQPEENGPSRRARKQVNYTLPSLRTKMRREENSGEQTAPRRIKKEDPYERKVVRRTSKERDLAGIAATTPTTVGSESPKDIDVSSKTDFEGLKKEQQARRRRTSSFHSPINVEKDSNVFELAENGEGNLMGRKRRISMVA